MECMICGKEYPESSLLEALSYRELLKVCEPCFKKEGLLLIKRPTQEQIEKSKAITPYYKKFSTSSTSSTSSPTLRQPTRSRNKSDYELMKMANKNYEKNLVQYRQEKIRYIDLIDNFNWKILNARRARKTMREQMAQKLEVPESAIKLAEQGILPENYHELIKKIENYLGIKLFKGKADSEKIVSSTSSSASGTKEVKIDKDTTKNLKISDLKKIEEDNLADEISDFEND